MNAEEAVRMFNKNRLMRDRQCFDHLSVSQYEETVPEDAGLSALGGIITYAGWESYEDYFREREAMNANANSSDTHSMFSVPKRDKDANMFIRMEFYVPDRGRTYLAIMPRGRVTDEQMAALPVSDLVGKIFYGYDLTISVNFDRITTCTIYTEDGVAMSGTLPPDTLYGELGVRSTFEGAAELPVLSMAVISSISMSAPVMEDPTLANNRGIDSDGNPSRTIHLTDLL